ncbi:MAG: SLATT domain-containing protein [Actinomycetota bacterium]
MPRGRNTAAAPPKGPGTELLARWAAGLNLRCIAYDKAATDSARLSNILVIATALASGIASLSVFASADKSGSVALRIVAGILSGAAAALAVIQKTLDYDKKSAKWHEASARLNGLQRRAEALAEDEANGQDVKGSQDKLQQDWEEAEKDLPAAPQRAWEYAYGRMKAKRI